MDPNSYSQWISFYLWIFTIIIAALIGCFINDSIRNMDRKITLLNQQIDLIQQLELSSVNYTNLSKQERIVITRDLRVLSAYKK